MGSDLCIHDGTIHVDLISLRNRDLWRARCPWASRLKRCKAPRSRSGHAVGGPGSDLCRVPLTFVRRLLHGPYVYLHWREGSRQRKVYVPMRRLESR
jgi:hypothetical protein